MHVQEVIGRWQAQEGQRSIAHAMGIARVTVRRYIGHAKKLGIMHSGPPPSEAQLVELVRAAHAGLGHARAQPSSILLEPYTEMPGCKSVACMSC